MHIRILFIILLIDWIFKSTFGTVLKKYFHYHGKYLLYIVQDHDPLTAYLFFSFKKNYSTSIYFHAMSLSFSLVLRSVNEGYDFVFDNLTIFVPILAVFFPASLAIPVLSVNQQHHKEQKSQIRHEVLKACRRNNNICIKQ